jgi:hypothetical protein
VGENVHQILLYQNKSIISCLTPLLITKAKIKETISPIVAFKMSFPARLKALITQVPRYLALAFLPSAIATSLPANNPMKTQVVLIGTLLYILK